MKASDALALLLANKKVYYGFELIGGMIAHIVDSINLLGKTKLISIHHEQAAAFAAGGIARATNNEILGVALGTSGPGATNLVTGIADCWLDSVPCVFITGQVNTYESKGNKQIRQQGFQELDIIKIVESITKYAVKIEHTSMLLPEVNKAINMAISGRPGPILIDIPMNIQRESVEESQLQEVLSEPYTENSICSSDLFADIAAIYDKLLTAQKPLVLFGGGALNTPLLPDFITKLEKLNIPYVASLKGKEKIPESLAYLGMIGSYGTRVANYAIQNADLLLVIGSRMDVRQTGSNCEDFARNAYIIQIDVDKHQLNNRIPTKMALEIDAHSFYEAILNQMTAKPVDNHWLNFLIEKKQHYYQDEYHEFNLSPFAIFHLVNEVFEHTNVQFTCDVGNNQMWAAHTLVLKNQQKMHHSGGLGAMGFSIPTSIGIQLASKVPVVSFSGDGGAQLNIQELDIIAREKLPILIIILNNKALGMVKNFQEMYFDGRDESTYWKQYSCDFVQIAKGYYIDAEKITNIADLKTAFEDFIANSRPMVLEVDLEFVNECRPRLSFGDKLDEQSPKKEIINK